MPPPDDLLDELLRLTPQQPAVAYWRAIEVAALLDAIRRQEPGAFAGLGLDLGCGDGVVTGCLLRRIPEPRPRVVGVDPDPVEASCAEQTGVYQRVHPAGGSAIPERPGTFDWVLANSVLEHVPDLPPVLREVARVLKPGGRLWITAPGPEFHGALKGPGLLAPLLGRGAEYFRRLDRRLQHVRYWSAAEWTAALATCGLQVIQRTPYMSAGDARRWEWVSSWTGGVVWSLAGKARGEDRTNLAIQRSLGLSTGSWWNRLLVLPARALLAASRLKGRPSADAGPFACLLVVATKTGA